ncbi:MAG: YaeQ family protein [Saccharospirillum sp.]|jgi:uncharacterized protein YaeQ
MALRSTVYKANLNIADMDRGYYADHSITLALHPSETQERMMVRLLAFILNASDALTFARGISGDDDEPELFEQALNGDITLWVAFGQPDEKWLRKASNRAARVLLYSYGGRSLGVWWPQHESALQRYRNLAVWAIPDDQIAAMVGLVERSMVLQASISEGQVWLSNSEQSVHIVPELLKETLK